MPGLLVAYAAYAAWQDPNLCKAKSDCGVQVVCSLAGAMPGSGEAACLHLPQAHLIPPLQAVVLGEL